MSQKSHLIRTNPDDLIDSPADYETMIDIISHDDIMFQSKNDPMSESKFTFQDEPDERPEPMNETIHHIETRPEPMNETIPHIETRPEIIFHHKPQIETQSETEIKTTCDHIANQDIPCTEIKINKSKSEQCKFYDTKHGFDYSLQYYDGSLYIEVTTDKEYMIWSTTIDDTRPKKSIKDNNKNIYLVNYYSPYDFFKILQNYNEFDHDIMKINFPTKVKSRDTPLVIEIINTHPYMPDSPDIDCIYLYPKKISVEEEIAFNNNKYLKKIGNVEKANAELVDSISSLDNKYSEQNESMIGISKKISELENELSECKKVGQSINVLNNKGCYQEQQISMFHTKLESINAMITDINTKHTRQDETMSNLQTKNTLFEQNMATLNTRNDTQDKQIAELQTNNTSLDQTIATIQNKIYTLEKEIGDANTKFVSQDQTIAGLHTTNYSQNKQIVELETKNTSLEQTIADIKAKYISLDLNMVAKDKIINELQEKMAQLEIKFNTCMSKLPT